ncbi:GNAT family N-acetyltransferase [Dactylosporangium sp. CA-092794]|uniref:GNAT family N-acetyltransferase n=1 Tax=Dactylosporangium sp. CA-092794 TaxID=3239929 RepID=UPI003D8A3F23
MELAGLPGWTVRGCTLHDVAAILSVTRSSDVAALGEPDWTEDEVVATLTAPNQDPAHDCWLALDPSGTPLAWAYVDNPAGGTRDNVEVYAAPGAHAAYDPLLDLALARVAERARSAGHPSVTLRAGAVPSETAYIAALTGHGFVFRKRHARMTRVLTGPERAGSGPSSLVIRPVRADDEAELRRFHAVLQAAFADTPDFEPVSFSAWRASVAAAPSVSFDEWFVSEISGQIVGVLQSSDQALDRNEGWVKNLAVLREHRKSGVGTALLRTAFAAYAAKGRTSAGLGVDLTNPTGAYSLYTSAGMAVAFAADMFERSVLATFP